MKQYLSPDDIANDIRMTRSQHRGAFVLVEGETADLRVYDRLIDRSRCQLQPAHGKDNVLEVMAILDADGFPGALGIVDADRSRLSGDLPPSENVLLTDGCDLESMLVHSPALDKVLAEVGSRDKIKRFEAEHGRSVRDHLAILARPVGALRHVSEREGLGLHFQELTFSKFVERDLTLDRVKLVRTVLARTHGQNSRLKEGELLEELRRIEDDPDVPSLDLSNGHDMARILSIGLRHALGSRKQLEVGVETIERELRLAYEKEHFQTSGLCAAIRSWERRNPPYVVIGEQRAQDPSNRR
ncbi:MAG TPA: DUF4435 domain-containing protein [Thermoanaerobaculia bacterium]